MLCQLPRSSVNWVLTNARLEITENIHPGRKLHKLNDLLFSTNMGNGNPIGRFKGEKFLERMKQIFSSIFLVPRVFSALFSASGALPRHDAEAIWTAMHVGTRGISKSTRRVLCLGIRLVTGFLAKLGVFPFEIPRKPSFISENTTKLGITATR